MAVWGGYAMRKYSKFDLWKKYPWIKSGKKSHAHGDLKYGIKATAAKDALQAAKGEKGLHQTIISPNDAPTIATRPAGRRKHVGYGREQNAYRLAKPKLLRDALGRYVVFVGNEMAGPYPSFRDAMRAGYRQFGLGPLYIKQVLEEEPAVDLGPHS
jgi:hypothetical protein